MYHNHCVYNNSSSVQCFVCMSDSCHDNVHTHSSLEEAVSDSNFFYFVYPTLCNYYSNGFLTNISQDQWNNSLSIYHVNDRSLVSNVDSLNLFLEAISKDFTVIGITKHGLQRIPLAVLCVIWIIIFLIIREELLGAVVLHYMSINHFK